MATSNFYQDGNNGLTEEQQHLVMAKAYTKGDSMKHIPVNVKQDELRAILIAYNCEEWGDRIIDEICQLFDYPDTNEGDRS